MNIEFIIIFAFILSILSVFNKTKNLTETFIFISICITPNLLGYTLLLKNKYEIIALILLLINNIVLYMIRYKWEGIPKIIILLNLVFIIILKIYQ